MRTTRAGCVSVGAEAGRLADQRSGKSVQNVDRERRRVMKRSFLNSAQRVNNCSQFMTNTCLWGNWCVPSDLSWEPVK